MEAGLELDRLVAEKIIGWTDIQIVPHWQNSRKVLEGIKPDTIASQYTGYRSKHVIPGYSSDIAASWTVVNKLNDLGFAVFIEQMTDGLCNAYIKKESLEISLVISETERLTKAPHAICLAALKAIGVKV